MLARVRANASIDERSSVIATAGTATISVFR